MNQQLTFLSDGGDTVRDLQLYMNPQAEHLLDWFHLAMRLTVMQQMAKGLPQTIRDDEATYMLRDPVVHQMERLKWSLWHGNVYKAFHKIAVLVMDLDGAGAITGDATARKLLKAMEEFHTYIAAKPETPEQERVFDQRQKLASYDNAAWLRSFDKTGRWHDPASGFWESRVTDYHV
jgi:hypothetical protein